MEILLENNKEYMIIGKISETHTSLLHKKIEKGTIMFLARHGKNLYFTDEISDKCIFKLNSEQEAKSLIEERINDVTHEAEFNKIKPDDIFVGYLAIEANPVLYHFKNTKSYPWEWDNKVAEKIDDTIDEVISNEISFGKDRITNKGFEFLENEAPMLIKDRLAEEYEDEGWSDIYNENNIANILAAVIYEYELHNGYLRVKEED